MKGFVRQAKLPGSAYAKSLGEVLSSFTHMDNSLKCNCSQPHGYGTSWFCPVHSKRTNNREPNDFEKGRMAGIKEAREDVHEFLEDVFGSATSINGKVTLESHDIQVHANTLMRKLKAKHG